MKFSFSRSLRTGLVCLVFVSTVAASYCRGFSYGYDSGTASYGTDANQTYDEKLSQDPWRMVASSLLAKIVW